MLLPLDLALELHVFTRTDWQFILSPYDARTTLVWIVNMTDGRASFSIRAHGPAAKQRVFLDTMEAEHPTAYVQTMRAYENEVTHRLTSLLALFSTIMQPRGCMETAQVTKDGEALQVVIPALPPGTKELHLQWIDFYRD